jgi:hypothetical protein
MGGLGLIIHSFLKIAISAKITARFEERIKESDRSDISV